jgi:UPF0716 family protein affecting phage T7 exclusion
MRTRRSRLALALGLLAVAWPAFAHLLNTVALTAAGLLTAHPAVIVTALGALLLLGTVPGPVDRALTRYATSRSTR